MGLMLSRPRLQGALKKEFEGDSLNAMWWVITSKRTAGGKCVVADHLGAQGTERPISMPACRGYMLRAYRLIAGMVNTEVEVSISLGDGIVCLVSPDTHGRLLTYGPEGYISGAPLPSVIRTPPFAYQGEWGPCQSCGLATGGQYARNVYQGAPDDFAELLRRRIPGMHLCPDCTEATTTELTREYLTSPESIRALIGTFRIPDETLRVRRIDSFLDMGEVAIPYLIDALADPDEAVSRCAATTLSLMGEPAVPFLAVSLGSENASVRKKAVGALVSVGESAIPMLVDRVAEDDIESLMTLAVMGQSAIPVLNGMAAASDLRLAAAAEKSIAAIDDWTERRKSLQ